VELKGYTLTSPRVKVETKVKLYFDTCTLYNGDVVPGAEMVNGRKGHNGPIVKILQNKKGHLYLPFEQKLFERDPANIFRVKRH